MWRNPFSRKARQHREDEKKHLEGLLIEAILSDDRAGVRSLIEFRRPSQDVLNSCSRRAHELGRRAIAEHLVSEGASLGHSDVRTAQEFVETVDDGTVFGGRYRIKRLLGSGGMGRVFLAEDLREKRDVALKCPHKRFLLVPGLVDTFKREIESLARFRSSMHVISVEDAGVQNDIPYMVMPYFNDGSLQQSLELNGRQTERAVLGWLRLIAVALDDLHQHQVVHLDVKPGNILMSGSVAWLSDFGLATVLKKAVDTDSCGQSEGVIIGSPAYMAPESISLSYSFESDQYSLGVTVFQALSGRLPHEATGVTELLEKKKSIPARPIEGVVPDLGECSARAVMRTLSRNPGERFSTCTAFVRAFDGVDLEGKKVLADSVGVGTVNDVLVLLNAGTELPASETISVSTATDRQPQIEAEIRASDPRGETRVLGVITSTKLPPMPKAECPIQLRLNVDQDGQVEAIVWVTSEPDRRKTKVLAGRAAIRSM